MAGNNGHTSQTIPPTITRIVTKNIFDSSHAHMVWVANADLPVNQSIKIGKMLFRFDSADRIDAVEVYGVGMIDGRTIGVRTTIRIEDVLCTDEVMDIATWTNEIRDAEQPDEEEEEEEEEVEEPEPAAVAELKPRPTEPAAAPPSMTTE